ncbi:PIN domain-like protein [Paraphysoderma sedebokerense]|nr:PIN domain-like protein [Paraphysoderma sedebokerense]
MGIKHFKKILKRYAPHVLVPTSILQQRGTTVAVDGTLFFMRFWNSPNKGVKHPHLQHTLEFCRYMQYHDIKPIFVFDGSYRPTAKRIAREHRDSAREKILNELQYSQAALRRLTRLVQAAGQSELEKPQVKIEIISSSSSKIAPSQTDCRNQGTDESMPVSVVVPTPDEGALSKVIESRAQDLKVKPEENEDTAAHQPTTLAEKDPFSPNVSQEKVREAENKEPSLLWGLSTSMQVKLSTESSKNSGSVSESTGKIAEQSTVEAYFEILKEKLQSLVTFNRQKQKAEKDTSNSTISKVLPEIDVDPQEIINQLKLEFEKDKELAKTLQNISRLHLETLSREESFYTATPQNQMSSSINSSTVVISTNASVKLPDDHSEFITHLVSRSQKLTKRANTYGTEHIAQATTLLTLLGIPYFINNTYFEAEHVCCRLVEAKLADKVITDDTDSFAFSDDVPILRNFYRNHGMNELTGRQIREALDFDRNQWIDYVILCGTDYSGTLYKVGPVNALKLLKEFGSVEGILKNKPDIRKELDWNYKEARECFLSGGPTDEELKMFVHTALRRAEMGVDVAASDAVADGTASDSSNHLKLDDFMRDFELRDPGWGVAVGGDDFKSVMDQFQIVSVTDARF